MNKKWLGIGLFILIIPMVFAVGGIIGLDDDLVPTVNGIIDLGSISRYFNKVYTNGVDLNTSTITLNSNDLKITNNDINKDFGVDLNVDGTSSNVLYAEGTTGNISHPLQSYVQAYRNGDQTISNITETTIIYNVEVTDTQNEFDTSTGIWTAKEAGKYLFNVNTTWEAANANVVYLVRLYCAGTNVVDDRWYVASNAQEIMRSFGYTCNITAAGQTGYVAVYQNSGGNEDVFAPARTRTNITIIKVA